MRSCVGLGYQGNSGDHLIAQEEILTYLGHVLGHVEIY